MKHLIRGFVFFVVLLLINYINPFTISKTYAASFGAVSTNLTDYPNQKVPQYNKFELTFTISSAYTNPFNPDEVKIDGYFTTPSSQTLVQPGFYYQNYTVAGIGSSETYTPLGNPVWKVRFTPKEVGSYSYYIRLTDRNGTVNSITSTFDVVPSASSGFVNVSPKNGRYFEYDSGGSFIGLGLNASWWQEENKRITNYQYYLNRMGEYKANLARVWMTNSGRDQNWILSIQDQNLGSNYNLEEAWAFDYILNIAEEKGVAFLLTLDDVNQYTYNWDGSNLYNTSLGGPCSYPSCIFTSSTAKKFQKNIFRYIVARWGYSPSILSWEFFNEIDELQWSTDNWDWQAVLNWHQEMAQYIRNIDPHQHMTNTSTGSFKTHPDLYSGIPEMSFSQLHFYYVPGWPWAISDPAGRDMANLMRYYSFELYSSVNDKPSIIGEWGILNSGWTDAPELTRDDNGVHLHNGLWSSLMSGLAATGLSWHWSYHKTYDTKWWQHYKALASYLEGIDTMGLTALKPANVTFIFPAPPGGDAPEPYPDNRSNTLLSSNSKLRALGLRNTSTVYLWIQNTDNTWWNDVNSIAVTSQSGTISVLGLNPNTNYSLEWWNAYEGTMANIQAVVSDGTGKVTFPVSNLSTDIALKLIRTVVQVTPTVSPTPIHCPPLGDVNCSSTVDAVDLSLLLSRFASVASPPTAYDIDDNGKVNILDAAVIIKNFGQHIP